MADQLTTFVGKWKLDRSENVDEMLTAMGWNEELRKKANEVKPIHDIKVENGAITIFIDAQFATNTETFKLGEEFETDNAGRKGKVIASYDDGKLVFTPTPDSVDSKLPKITRAVTPDGELCMQLFFSDLVCTSYFKKL